jgi:hypothetical protein
MKPKVLFADAILFATHQLPSIFALKFPETEPPPPPPSNSF